ncbi:MAG TPA: membrane protein insertase YidC [Candidatus Acidoferrales bacterium]|nr:membrane protein insertase YidC [Candidatus Acidoferrales bacterium]
MNDMSDQVRGIIFVVLVLLVVLLWSRIYSPPVLPPQKSAQTAARTSPGQPNAAQTNAIPAQSGGTAVKAGTSAQPAKVKIETVQAAAAKTVVVESPLYRVELSNRGGVVQSWKLKAYFDDENPPRPLELVDSDASKQLGWPLSLSLSDTQLENEANSALYEISPAADHVTAPADITFHWSDGHLDISKKLHFTQDYEMSVEISASLDGRALPSALAWRGGFGDKSVYKASQLVSVFYKTNGKLTLLQYKKLGVSGNQSQPLDQAGPMEFLGIEDQFFTATFIPAGTDLSLWHWTQEHKIVTDNKPATEPEAEMAAGTTMAVPLRMNLYVGPKDLALLGKVKPSLEGLVNFGWTGVIAKPLLFILQWLHRYIPNWGWTIVVVTLVINFALFPLKMKSQRSMQKMAKVGPEVRSIQDRYKKYSMNDPRKRKMNEEVMAIYQREGINPIGGCLPMLPQLPIWWALWRVLTGAIELRHAPWIGWIHDLSVKDPYYILPIAMAILMYLSTKMTPQTTVDPSQQKMMTFMPLMMAAFFFNLSSGLNLYMFTSNLVSVGQQWYLNRTQPMPVAKGKFKKKTE